MSRPSKDSEETPPLLARFLQVIIIGTGSEAF